MAIGTHSLISASTDFQRLGLVVVDEQHRFGVRQRARLAEKGANENLPLLQGETSSSSSPSAILPSPHVLAMSATPIPRTLALALHGDMALSQISQVPSGRGSLTTKVFSESRENREKAFSVGHILALTKLFFSPCFCL